MISNERPSPYGYRPRTRPSAQPQSQSKYGSFSHAGFGDSGGGNPGNSDHSGNSGNSGNSHGPTSHKPQVSEDTLRTEKIQIERKTFILTLKENPRGRFLRITEDVNGRRENIIIPSTGLEEFRRLVDEMAKAAGEIPPLDETPPNIPEDLHGA
jgi:hypothetical protein